MDLNIKFANPQQREFFYARQRKQCFSGAFNNGKTFIACLKGIVLLLTFPNYRVAFGRQTFMDLKKTTMETFFSLLPPDMLASHNNQEGITTLKNGSLVYWLHLDNVDENTLRGLEINAFVGDQAEEFDEKVYLVLLARIGRWSHAVIPQELLDQYPDWPTSSLTGRPLAPSYMMLLCNPADQLHFIFRKYHPDSIDREDDVFFIEGEWDANLGSKEAYDDALRNDPEWVNKYVRGKWGVSAASIHYLPAAGLLEATDELLKRIKTRGNLFRTLDHGDSSATCCLWWAALEGVYICYREYYVPGKVISYHRRAISDLSGDEDYVANYADPSIFKKTSQKDGGFWTIHDEYITSDCPEPPLHWLPADNNEFATRNRINELLQVSNNFVHPITKERPAIGMYFVARSINYPQGCYEAPRQLQSQKRLALGTYNGKTLYSDDRDTSVIDHAYDPIRYFVAMHGSQPTKAQRVPTRSFAYFNAVRDHLTHRKVEALSVPNS